MTEYSKEDPSSIQAMFGSIAKRYDKANAILSLQMHKHWNAKLVKAVSQGEITSFLDLCCGTGDIAFELLKQQHHPRRAFLLDFCPEMLACAKEKAKLFRLDHHFVTYIQGDAQAVPLDDASVSCITIAYGIRNVNQPRQCIKEAFRLLQPGGVFGILELTQPKNSFLRMGHQIYLKAVLPLLGRWLTSNEQAYQYLCNSIHSFIPPDELENLMKHEGFTSTHRHSLCGGIATIITGRKP